MKALWKRGFFTDAQKERAVAGVDDDILGIEILEERGFTTLAANLRAVVVVLIIDPARRQLPITIA